MRTLPSGAIKARQGRRRDKFTKARRSEIMSRIRSKNSGLDLAMKTLLRKARIDFEMYPKLYGKPDFLIFGKLALFCDSSFWHGRNWRKLRGKLLGGNNASYWIDHILSNRRRDRMVTGKLRGMGCLVVRVWDEEVFEEPDACIRRIRLALS
jgi:DNA mismatch endonuclease (patch repair protein)